jgi:rare lipoprotein A
MTKFLFFLLLLPLLSQAQIKEFGQASFYADKFEGRMTASGEIYNHSKLTAAHRTLPFGTLVKVTNTENNQWVEVIINDRGPFVDNRVIDLSLSAARKLGFEQKGVANVRIEVLSIPTNNPNPIQATQQTQQYQQPAPVAAPTVAAAAQPEPKATEPQVYKEYYKIETQGIEPKGFGIQIASYQEAANLLRICNALHADIKKGVMIQISELNGTKLYRIIVGPFATRDEAEKFKKKLNSYPDSFIVAL